LLYKIIYCKYHPFIWNLSSALFFQKYTHHEIIKLKLLKKMFGRKITNLMCVHLYQLNRKITFLYLSLFFIHICTCHFTVMHVEGWWQKKTLIGSINGGFLIYCVRSTTCIALHLIQTLEAVAVTDGNLSLFRPV